MAAGSGKEGNVIMDLEKVIRVMVVDDHTMVRKGLATFMKIFDDIELVGEAACAEDAIQLCGEIMPDVMLLDIVLPDQDGITVTKVIRKQYPSVQVIALSSFQDEMMVLNAMEAGAVGYLLKDISADELSQAIHGARTGHVTLSPAAANIMIHAANHKTEPGHDLTEAEHVVLSYLVEGLNNTQIAKELVVSPSTIKSHVSNILAKLDASSRTEAVAIAIRSGLAV
jgi:NarL family two-component system response regulator LiaR